MLRLYRPKRRPRRAEAPFLKWVAWFAWRPVITEKGETVWLRWIERRFDGYGGGHDFTYRIPIPAPEPEANPPRDYLEDEWP
jgi:hypothetical protein